MSETPEEKPLWVIAFDKELARARAQGEADAFSDAGDLAEDAGYITLADTLRALAAQAEKEAGK